MRQNPSLAGAADAIERSKNTGSDLAEQAQDAFGGAADRARRALSDTRETAQMVASEAYDQVGEAYRTGEDYVRRWPFESLALVAIAAFAAGYFFRR
jgi:ElaB/YqjD/DUF883 family membrane-anchored ribosome-binding protein